KQTRTLPTVLAPAEVERLFTALGAAALRAVLMLAYGAGLRIGEACRLRMQDINSRAGVIHVRSTRDRDVMLSPKLLAELRAYWRRRRRLFEASAGRAAPRLVEHRFWAAVREASLAAWPG